MEYYVYCHQRKDNGKCFYIGKGKGKRYEDTQFRNRHWHFTVDKYGFTPIILVSGLSEEKAFELEASFVEQIGVENLTNCDVPKAWGGHSKSEETKAKIGNTNRRPKPKDFWKNRSIPVQCFKDGILIAEYKSAQEAHRQTNIKIQGINNALKNRAHSAGGYIWKYNKSKNI